MKLHLPNSAFLGNIDPFLHSFDPKDPQNLHITSNQKWISVHPMVLCMVAALGLTVAPQHIIFDSLEARSKHYLVRMGLFDILGLASDISVQEHEPAGRFVPITQIKNSDQLSQFITDMIPLLHLEPEQAHTICYIVSELVRNVIEHANSKQGALICAQYYEKSHSIRIGIADTGLGIKHTINKSHIAPSDLDAIQMALTPGITGTTKREGGTEQNAGAGLFFIKSIACVNRDFFVLYSGNGFYKLLKRTGKKKLTLHANPSKDRHSIGSTDNPFPYWQGTLVGIDINLDQTQEFSLLLDAIRKTYTSAVRERKKARYKKPKFI